MGREPLFQLAVFAIPAAFAIFFLVRVVRFGGLKGALLGARITSTVGEVTGATRKPVRMVLRVHALDGAADRKVGVELVAKSVFGYQTMPMSLSVAEANRLVSLVQTALQADAGTESLAHGSR